MGSKRPTAVDILDLEYSVSAPDMHVSFHPQFGIEGELLSVVERAKFGAVVSVSNT